MSFFEQYRSGNLVLPNALFFHFKDIFPSADDFLVWQFLYLQTTTQIGEVASSQIGQATGKTPTEVNKSINAINKSITPLVIKIPGKVKNHPGLKLMNSKIFILSPSPLLFYFNDNKKRRKNQFFSSLHFYFTQFNVFHGSEFGGEISKVIISFFTGCSNSSLYDKSAICLLSLIPYL